MKCACLGFSNCFFTPIQYFIQKPPQRRGAGCSSLLCPPHPEICNSAKICSRGNAMKRAPASIYLLIHPTTPTLFLLSWMCSWRFYICFEQFVAVFCQDPLLFTGTINREREKLTLPCLTAGLQVPLGYIAYFIVLDCKARAKVTTTQQHRQP